MYIRGKRLLQATTYVLVSASMLLAIAQFASAQSYVQGYATNTADITSGMAVSRAANSTEEKPVIERATRSKQNHFVGIVVDAENTVASVPSSNSTTPVASVGSLVAYVNDGGGTIAKGDLVSLSHITGTLEKAIPSDTFIVGTALEDFNTTNAQTEQIKEAGETKSIKITKQRIEVKPYFRVANTTDSRSSIAKAGSSLAGKPVSEIQAIAALAVFILVIVVEAAIIFAVVKYSLVSVGRNPLSEHAIYKQVTQIAYLTLIVFVFGAFIIYGVLWI